MRIQKIIFTTLLVSVTGILAACGSNQNEATTVQKEITSAETQPEQTTEDASSVDFNEYTALLGMADADTADLFGGGKENWTEDYSFYIGRIYQLSLDGKKVSMYTTCDKENKITSVSIWLTDGEQEVTQEEVDQWIKHLSDFTDSEPTVQDSTTSEGGSKSWKWSYDQKFITLRLLGNILTIDINPAVGELK